MRLRNWMMISMATMAVASTARAADANLNALDDISLENLGNIVTSVSKRPEDSFKSAAAITVITQEDIRLSGATHLAEVLRGVPGLDVARVDASNWAITSRGFNDTFANKLLVLVDGRTVYTPLFSGVYWDIQDVVLEDIERIEVIRGPGAALWGANAVNGVINIITKKADKTQGTYVSQLVGTQDRSITEARYGGSVGDNLFYRAYAKFSDRMASQGPNDTNGNNHWTSGKAGFRTDVDISPDRKLTVQGDVYNADIHLNDYLPSSTPPAYVDYVNDKIQSRGANVLGKLTQKHGDGMESTFQLYYDFQSPDYSVLHQNIHTLDFDYQTSWAYDDRNNIVWGAGYRLVADQFDGTSTLTLSPLERNTSLFSAFLQDTYALIPKTLDLTVGSKFEHNDYTGFEVQPNARLAWYPTANQTVWGAVSRAVRTPSRAESDIRLNVVYDPTNLVFVQEQGIKEMDSEELTAYELGYRWRVTPKFSVDSSVFYNDYSNLRTFEFGAVQVAPNGDFILPAQVLNLGEGNTEGVELSSTWDVLDWWSLKGSYTYLQMDLKTEPASTDTQLALESGKVPKNQFSLRSNFQLSDDIEWTNTVYYVDKLPVYGVSDYVRLDTRVAWKAMPGVEVSLVGQNLLDNAHQEFGAPLAGVPNEIERNLYAKVSFKY